MRRQVVGCFIAIALLLLSGCTSLFFFPLKEKVYDPDDYGVNYEKVSLTTQDNIRLNAWLFKAEQSKPRGVIYFLHGNAENISTHFLNVHWLPKHGYDVLLLDYRGFGASKGKPSLPEICWDIDAGFEWLDQRYNDQTPRFFLGQSIGASLGIYWLANREVFADRFSAVVFDAPFHSYPGMVRDVLQRSWLTWPIAYPVSWVYSSRYDTLLAAEKLPQKKSLLFFHSREDQVVPFKHSEKVFEALNMPKHRVIYSGKHTTTFNDKENRQKLLEFLAHYAE